MNRHPFRWESLAFGLFFLSVVGNWAVWQQDLLTPRQLGLVASGVLIVLGLAGVAATLWQGRPAAATATATATREGGHDDDAHPQP